MDKEKLFPRMLSFLFPVRMPKPVPLDFIFVEDEDTCLEDGIGKVKIRPYRDAIDRHWKTCEKEIHK